jgi:Family of unknown function (DUF6529)
MAQAEASREEYQPPISPWVLLIPAAIGGAVAIGLGIYGNEHNPAREGLPDLFFSATLNLKAWFATAAVILALFQLYSAGVMWGRFPFPGEVPSWLGLAHRFSGTFAFLFTLPVAYHCLYSLGFQDAENGTVPVIEGNRVVIHSIFGCLWFGAFTAKVIVVETKRLPGLALPIVGGLLFTALVVVWYTSAFWFFTEIGFPEF